MVGVISLRYFNDEGFALEEWSLLNHLVGHLELLCKTGPYLAHGGNIPC